MLAGAALVAFVLYKRSQNVSTAPAAPAIAAAGVYNTSGGGDTQAATTSTADPIIGEQTDQRALPVSISSPDALSSSFHPLDFV